MQKIILFSFFFAGLSFAQTTQVGANALFLYQNSNFHRNSSDPLNVDPSPNGLRIRELELQLGSTVDPFTKLNILLGIHSEYESDGTSVEEVWNVEPEEAFVESTFIPLATVKLGKIKAAMGNHNLLHTHEFPFIQAPLANSLLLGDEGFNDVGLSGAFMMPTSWLSEVTFQYFRGAGENEQFNSATPGDGVGLVRLKNLWNVNRDMTFELGASTAQGKNSFGGDTTLVGGDVALKWKPDVPGRYNSWSWTFEYLARTQEQPGLQDETGKGLSTWLEYQFSQRCTAMYRFDNLFMQDTFDAEALPNNTVERHSFAINFYASPTSSFKIEYDQKTGGALSARGESHERALFIQGNFTIGSPSAHGHVH